MKYSKRRSYRDQVVVEVETVVKKTKKKKEDGLIKSLFKKLTQK
jgi:hypothetical protein